jgi:hypothetical protein
MAPAVTAPEIGSLAKYLGDIFGRVLLKHAVQGLLDHWGDEGLEVPLDGVHYQGGDGRHQGIQLRGQTHHLHLEVLQTL